MPRRRPIAVQHALATGDRKLLSILGQAGNRRRMLECAWRSQDRDAIQHDIAAQKEAAAHEFIKEHGLDNVPVGHGDPDYQFIPY